MKRCTNFPCKASLRVQFGGIWQCHHLLGVCRKLSLEMRLQSAKLSEEEKRQERETLEQQERDFVRLQRQRMSSDDFEALKLIGRGAFGEVPYGADHEILQRRPVQPP